MTTVQRPSRLETATRDRRRALLEAVHTAEDVLVAADPTCLDGTPAKALAHARAIAEDGDASAGRAAAAVRTAWAHLAAGGAEDAFLALESAREVLAER